MQRIGRGTGGWVERAPRIVADMADARSGVDGSARRELERCAVLTRGNEAHRQWGSGHQAVRERGRVGCLDLEHELTLLELDDLDLAVLDQVADRALDGGGLLVARDAVEDELEPARRPDGVPVGGRRG